MILAQSSEDMQKAKCPDHKCCYTFSHRISQSATRANNVEAPVDCAPQTLSSCHLIILDLARFVERL